MKRRTLALLAPLTLLVPAGLTLELPATASSPNHPTCPGIVVDLAPGQATPIAGEVFLKVGDEHISIGFHEAGFVIPATFDGKEVSHADVCPPAQETTTSTTTTLAPPPPPPSSSTTTTTTSSDTTTTSSTTPGATTTSTTPSTTSSPAGTPRTNRPQLPATR